MTETQIQDMFKPLIGLHTWQVRQGHGTFLTFEFGKPHIRVREPKKHVSSNLESVERHFQRRKITVVGEWHLWIQYAKWSIETMNHKTSDSDEDSKSVKDSLEEVDGQILLQAEVSNAEKKITLTFDLGAKIIIFPDADFYDEDLLAIYNVEGECNSISANPNGFKCSTGTTIAPT